MSKEKAKEQWRNVCPPTTSWLKISVKLERMASFDYSHRQGIIEFLSNQLTKTKQDLLTFLQTRMEQKRLTLLLEHAHRPRLSLNLLGAGNRGSTASS